MENPNINPALLTNDAVVFGLLMIILALIFYTSSRKDGFWAKFYTYVPSVLLCYFIPALLNTFGIISGNNSQLYSIASQYLLPASLILLTLGIDMKSLRRLGPKAIYMFFAGTIGIVIGGPIAFALVGNFFPDVFRFGEAETWRGLSTIAGSWIGGGANQAAMLEVFGADKTLFAQMIAVDVIVANIWLGILLYSSQHRDRVNRFFRADNSEIIALEQRMEKMHLENSDAKSGTSEWMVILGVAFGGIAISHFFADLIAPWLAENYPNLAQYSLTSGFFWIVTIATTIGLLLSLTKARKLEQQGASNFGSLFLYVLVATIGMSMDLKALFDNPKFFMIGGIWICIHALIMIVIARIIKAPLFLLAVGSQANVGGAASAPIVAVAFNRFLAPVGVLLAVLGYAVGTYGGYLTGLLLQWVSGIMS